MKIAINPKHPLFLICSKITVNVPALGEVANFGTDYFLSKIKFLAKCKRVFTTKFAILPNACYPHFIIASSQLRLKCCIH